MSRTTSHLELPRSRSRRRIWLKLATFVWILILIMGAMHTVHHLWTIRAVLKDQIQSNMQSTVQSKRQIVKAYLDRQRERVQLIASRTRLRKLIEYRDTDDMTLETFRDDTVKILNDALQAAKGFDVIMVASPTGEVLTSTSDDWLAHQFADDSGFLAGRDKPYVDLNHVNDGVLRISAPAKTDAGKLLGVIVVIADQSGLEGIVRDTIGLGESGRILIGVPANDSAAKIVYPRQLSEQITSETSQHLNIMNTALSSSIGFVDTNEVPGLVDLAAYAPVIGESMGIVALLDAEKAYAPLRYVQRNMLLISLSLLILGTLAVFLYSRQFSQPIQEMSHVAKRVAAGELDTSISVRSNDELGDLARSFNEMTSRLNTSYSKLQASEVFNRTVLETAGEAVITIDSESRIYSINPAAEVMFGYPKLEIIGKRLTDLIHGPVACELSANDDSQLGHHKLTEQTDDPIYGQRKDGTTFAIELSLSSMQVNSQTMYTCMIRDINDRVAAERELVERHRDLQTMLYVIAHDLREPLRTVMSFSGLTAAKFAKNLGDQGQDYLSRIIRAADRMTQLLTDIGTLSRIENTQLATEPIDINTLTNDVLEELGPRIKRTKVIVKIADTLPTFYGQPALIRQVIMNLVANAIKFTEDSGESEVEIASYTPKLEEPGDIGIMIRDRGPGVPKSIRERIFQLFQRGVGREVEGTGTGLAIVRQIVNRHGGFACVRPRSGGGSDFIVTFNTNIALEPRTRIGEWL